MVQVLAKNKMYDSVSGLENKLPVLVQDSSSKSIDSVLRYYDVKNVKKIMNKGLKYATERAENGDFVRMDLCFERVVLKCSNILGLDISSDITKIKNIAHKNCPIYDPSTSLSTGPILKRMAGYCDL